MIIASIENGMKALSELDLDQFSSYWIYFLIILFAFLFYSIYFKKNSPSFLDDLRIANDNQSLKVKNKGLYLEFSNIRPSVLNKKFWRDRFEPLGVLYNSQFIDIRFTTGFKPTVQLFFNRLPSQVPLNESPDLLPMETWLGKNQFLEDVIINLQDTPSLYLDGKPGSGKTIALLAILYGYLKGIKKRVDVIIVTTKPSDFYILFDNKQINLTLIDPFDGNFNERLKEIMNTFDPIISAEALFKEAAQNLETNNSIAMNLEEFKRQGICEDTTRKFYIFDEAKDYLSKNKADSKLVAQSKIELVSVVYTHIRRTARFLSMPIVISSQTQNEGDLDIPLKMFHLRLASATNEAISKLLVGDKRLTDLSYTKGKFFLKTDKEEHVIRIPIA